MTLVVALAVVLPEVVGTVGVVTGTLLDTVSCTGLQKLSFMAPCIRPMMVQLVSAPTIKTSPCAKLIRLMMPYTMV